MNKNSTIECILAMPEQTRTYAGLESVTVPGLSGSLEILPDHAELFALIGAGNVILKYAGGRSETVVIPGCECHVQNNKVVIVA